MTPPNDARPLLSPDELEALWREAWVLARRACGGTLAHLRRGQGGLYEADDFAQDAFLAFRALALRWAARDPRPPVGELWSAWRRALWHGGSSILRRPPQRLWLRRPSPTVDLEAALDSLGACRDGALARALRADLVQPPTAEADLLRREAIALGEDMRRRVLPTLPAGQRRLIELGILEGRGPTELGHLLGITPDAARQRLRRALQRLRAVVQREQSVSRPAPALAGAPATGHNACVRIHATQERSPMDTLKAMATRYSYRGAFTGAPVPREDLQKIVEAGLQAPSASNTQTTSYVIIDDATTLARMAEIIPNSKVMQTAKAMLVVLTDWHDPQSERPDFALVNYGASVENALLAATALGYATLWMEGWKRAEGAVAAVAALIGVPKEFVPAVVIPIGVAETPGTPREKRPFAERAWWNKYSG